MDQSIATVRSFNRVVTQRIGALSDHYLGRGRPLSESRLLFEIGVNGAKVGDLRAALDLDSGYLSRMLRSLERKGLVSTTMATDDGRARFAQLTRAGHKELAKLNELSDAQVEAILEPLSPKQRETLVSAMGEVERLLKRSAVSCDVENLATPDAQQCLASYFKELNVRFSAGFDPVRSPTHAAAYTPPHGYFVVARLFHRPVGCGGIMIKDDRIAEIKRMWVADHARGLGLGRRILQELEHLARSRGSKVVRLETNKALREAQAMYRSSGYKEVKPFNDEPYAHVWFEKRLPAVRSRR